MFWEAEHSALFLDLDAGHMGVSSCENSLGLTLMI